MVSSINSITSIIVTCTEGIYMYTGSRYMYMYMYVAPLYVHREVGIWSLNTIPLRGEFFH